MLVEGVTEVQNGRRQPSRYASRGAWRTERKTELVSFLPGDAVRHEAGYGRPLAGSRQRRSYLAHSLAPGISNPHGGSTMKRLFRFTRYRHIAFGRFGTGGFTSSPAISEEPSPAMPGPARPALQALSAIHHTLLSDGSTRGVCTAVDRCDGVDPCAPCTPVAPQATDGWRTLVETSMDTSWEAVVRTTDQLIESGTSRGGPLGQAGLGDSGLPFSRPLSACAPRPPGPGLWPHATIITH